MGSSSVSNGVVVAIVFAAVVLVVFPGPVANFVKGPQDVPTEGAAWKKSASSLLPNFVKEPQDAAGEKSASSFWTVSNLLRIAHVIGFATNFGTTLWVSFIGGVIMFKHLPRHQFGNLQSHLFPAYFTLSAVSLAFNVATLSVFHPVVSSTVWEKVQVAALGLSLLFTLVNLLVMEPITTKLMRERHRAEKEDGISTEPGVNRKKEIEKAGPKLRAINKKFGAAHGISSLLNLFSFLGLLVHAAYLGGRLSL